MFAVQVMSGREMFFFSILFFSFPIPVSIHPFAFESVRQCLASDGLFLAVLYLVLCADRLVESCTM